MHNKRVVTNKWCGTALLKEYAKFGEAEQWGVSIFAVYFFFTSFFRSFSFFVRFFIFFFLFSFLYQLTCAITVASFISTAHSHPHFVSVSYIFKHLIFTSNSFFVFFFRAFADFDVLKSHQIGMSVPTFLHLIDFFLRSCTVASLYPSSIFINLFCSWWCFFFFNALLIYTISFSMSSH